MGQRRYLFLLICSCALSGCVRRVTVPLCPAIALKSYPPGVTVAPGEVVNAFLTQEATKEKLQLNVLSPVAVEISGRSRKVEHIEQKYPFVLCAFYDPGAVTDYADRYIKCMQSAPGWVQTVQSNKPEDLLLPRSNYANVCVQGADARSVAPPAGGVRP